MSLIKDQSHTMEQVLEEKEKMVKMLQEEKMLKEEKKEEEKEKKKEEEKEMKEAIVPSKIDQLVSTILSLSAKEQDKLYDTLQFKHVEDKDQDKDKDHDVNNCKLCLNPHLRDTLSYYIDVRYFCQGCMAPAPPDKNVWDRLLCTCCNKCFSYCDSCIETSTPVHHWDTDCKCERISIEDFLWSERAGVEYYQEFSDKIAPVVCKACAKDQPSHITCPEGCVMENPEYVGKV